MDMGMGMGMAWPIQCYDPIKQDLHGWLKDNDYGFSNWLRSSMPPCLHARDQQE